MTQTTIGGKGKGRWTGGREPAGRPQAGRHRLAVFAAMGAVAVGAIALAGAVSGNIWSGASLDRAEAARQVAPQTAKAADAAAIPAKAADEAKATSAIKVSAIRDEAQHQSAPEAEPTRVAGGKADSLSPDERIERAMERVTAGSTDASIKNAIKVAAREKGDELRQNADTTITAALPDTSAYAPAAGNPGPQHEEGALDAIRELDRSTRTASLEPEAPATHTASLEPETPKSEEEHRKPKPQEKAPAPQAAKPSGPMAPASVTAAVHMRAGMDNGSAVIATVPAGAKVQASQSCEGWCQVSYDGRRGYIYKSFIRRSGAAAAKAPAGGKAATTRTASAEAGATAGTAAASAASKATDADGNGILTQTGSAEELKEAAQRAQRSR